MRVYDLIDSLQFFQHIKIIRTNDYGEEYLEYEGTVKGFKDDMDEEMWLVLSYSVVVIEMEHDLMIIKAEDKYFWQSDRAEQTEPKGER